MSNRFDSLHSLKAGLNGPPSLNLSGEEIERIPRDKNPVLCGFPRPPSAVKQGLV